jgi:hypothetical protein
MQDGDRVEPVKTLKQRYRSVLDLRHRIRALEDEVQECRQLNLRVAELCDVVTELLLPVADRDEQRVAEALERYRREVSESAGRGSDG